MAAQEIVVAKASELGELESVKFSFLSQGEEREGFVFRYRGELHAYRNECRHIPVTLDWTENRFLSRDECHIQCATHGALFEIDTGLCVSGPPAGETLRRLAVEVRENAIVVTVGDGA